MIPLLLFALFPHISLIEGNPEVFNGKYSFTESLTPYIHRHGSRLSHRSIRDCHQDMYGSQPHELFVAHKSNNSLPLIIHKRFVKAIPSPQFSPRTVRGHYIIVPDPLRTLSVLEPDQPGGCKLKIRQTVTETSAKHNCVASLNAGYFNTKDGSCLGNVISDGRRAQDSNGIQNVHFGLTEDGHIFVGYLSKEQFLSENFKQLVGGVVWILRNGSDFVNDSQKMECEDTEETGPMARFVSILSARSVVGHDKNGNIILLQVDGKSEVDGINLYEMQGLLKEFGFVNAVNLDGGGSSTLVMHGVTANYPYDKCDGEELACDRKVSTVLCVHPPYCEPNDCSEHGECSMGECVCQKNWLPPKCDKLFCGQNNCSENGICTSEGCVCYPGYFGDDCNKSCSDGWFGKMCTELCKCKNSDGCDPVTGKCICKPGFTGSTCEMSCPRGSFGPKCKFKCQCENSCYCDPVTGECNISHNSSLYYASVCLAKSIIEKQHLVKDNVEERRKWYLCIIVLGVITSLCLAAFLLLMFCSCSCSCRNEQVLCNRRRRHRKYPLQLPSGELSVSSSDDEFKSFPLKSLQKS